MASKAWAHYLQFRIQYSSIAFLYYDYALTFPSEVKYMWRKKLRFSTLYYICCRYALVANVLYALAKSNKLGSSCDAVFKFIGIISCMGRAAVLTTLTARTYAVYSCNKLILLLFVPMGITIVVLDMLDVPGSKCFGSSGNDVAATALSIMMVVFESFAAILLTIKSAMEFRVGNSWRIGRGSFFSLIFRQGIIYFAIVSIFSIAAVICNFRAPAGTFFRRLPNAYTLPLSCTLVARFLLQLRQWQEKPLIMSRGSRETDTTEDQAVQTLTAMRVATMIDSVLLSDFGDRSAVASSRTWESGDTLDQDVESKGKGVKRTEIIPLHDIPPDTPVTETGTRNSNL